MDLFRLWLMRMVRGAASGESNAEAVAGESELQARLVGAGSLDKWIDLWDTTNELTAKAFTVNLDRKQVVLSTFFELERTAQGA
jgi:DNA polymerase-3 subunit delta'